MPAAGRRTSPSRAIPAAARTRASIHAPIVAVALVVAMLLAGCTSGTTDDAGGSADDGTATTTAPGGERPAVGEWSPCRDGLECTTVEVPADWNDPDGQRIAIAAARRPADSGAPLGVILANPGGPGASGIEWLAGTGDLAGLGASFDIVSWDPRGVGSSTQLDCGGVGGRNGTDVQRAPTTGPDAAATADAVAAFVTACAEGSPDLIDHLGTSQGVADMDAVRAATDAAQVDVIGLSYGTYLGLAYAQAYPERVRTLVLDGVVDPADPLEDLLAAQASVMERQLDAVLAGDPGRWDRAAARTSPTTLAFAAIAASYSPTSLRQLPTALAAAAQGDDAALQRLADSYFDAVTYSAYLGTLCADLDRPTTAAEQAAMTDRLRAVAPKLGAAIAGEVAACARWPVPDGRQWTPATPSGVRILVIGGTGDAATPLGLAESVAGSLDGSVLVVRQGEGHISLGRSTCVANIVGLLLIDGTLPPNPTTCPG